MTWSACIQPVGAEHLVQSDPELYAETLEAFHAQVKRLGARVGPDGAVWVCPTCTFAETAELDTMIDALSTVRSHLLPNGIFLRGVIRNVELEAESLLVRSAGVRGFSCSLAATALARRCDELGGICLSVSVESGGARSAKKSLRTALTQSLTWTQVVSRDGRTGSMHRDIALSVDDRTHEMLEVILGKVDEARIDNTALRSYFVPLLVLWANSTRLGDSSDAGRELFALATSPTFGKRFGRVPGWRYVLYAAMLRLAGQLPNGLTSEEDEWYSLGLGRLQTRDLEDGLRDLPSGFGDERAKSQLRSDLTRSFAVQARSPEEAARVAVWSAFGSSRPKVAAAALRQLRAGGFKQGRFGSSKAFTKYCKEARLPLDADEAREYARELIQEHQGDGKEKMARLLNVRRLPCPDEANHRWTIDAVTMLMED